MQRLAQFGVSRQFLSCGARISAQLLFGVICSAAMIGVRTGIDIWAPTTGPFALIYPTIVILTLRASR